MDNSGTPQVQSLSDIVAQLQPAYQPEVNQINSQIQQAPQQEQAATTALGAAKDQAFNQIGQQAQQRGMLFSGFTPNEEAQYTATKYLPALAQLHQTTLNNQNQLATQLAAIDAQIKTGAISQQEGEQQAYNTYVQNQQKLAQQLAIADSRNQTTLEAAGMRAGATASAAATSAANSAAKQYSVSKLSSGNYSFTGSNKQPVNMYQYLSGAGLGVDSLLNLLQNGSKYDQAIYKNAAVQSAIKSNNPTAVYNAVKAADKGGYYGL